MTGQMLKWTFGPAILVTIFIAALSLFPIAGLALDTELLISQVIIAFVLIGVVFWAKQFSRAGWTKKSGYTWLWLAGPIWLAVLTPIGLAYNFFAEHPSQFAVIAATSLLVGLNEETIFRGFLLGGLRQHFSPMKAAYLSSLTFGLLHILNGLVGADPVFLASQMFVALGSGLVLSAVTMRAGSIWPALFLHFAGDTVGLAALGGFENATQTPEAATGMIIGGVIFCLWGTFWIWRLTKKGKLD